MGLLLLIVVIALVLGGLPRRGYHSYGYGPSGLVGAASSVLGPTLTRRLQWRVASRVWNPSRMTCE